MSEQLFAINTSHGNLSLKNGYISISFGGYAEIQAEDKEHPDFRDAFYKKWVSYSATEPKAGSLKGIKPIEFHEHNKGMTAEELKASNSVVKSAPVEQTEEAPSVPTTTALGQGDTIVTGEATVTKLGESSEPVVTEPTEIGSEKGKSKAGKK